MRGKNLVKKKKSWRRQKKNATDLLNEGENLQEPDYIDGSQIILDTGSVTHTDDSSDVELLMYALDNMISEYWSKKTFKVFTSNQIFSSTNTQQVQHTLDYLFPSGRGGWDEKARPTRCGFE